MALAIKWFKLMTMADIVYNSSENLKINTYKKFRHRKNP